MKKYLLLLMTFTLLTNCLNLNAFRGFSIPKQPQARSCMTASTWSTIASAPRKFANWIATAAHKTFSHVRQVRWQKMKIAKAGLCTVVVAGAVCYMVKLAKKLFHTPDVAIAEQAESAYDRTVAYQGLIDILIRHYGDSIGTPDCFARVDEGILDELAQAKNVAFNECISGIDRAIRDIERHRSRLDNRMHDMLHRVNHAPAVRVIYNRMLRTEEQMTRLLPHLRQLQSYMTHYRNYFELYDIEIHTIATHGNGLTQLPIYERSLYPHVECIERLNPDLTALIRAHTGIEEHTYPRRWNEVYHIVTNLARARDQVIGTDIYAQELRARHEEHQRHELIEIQRRQAEEAYRHAEQQLSIQQQQLREQQKANNLLALQQRQIRGSLTPNQYKEEMDRINREYSASTFVDATVTLLSRSVRAAGVAYQSR